MDRWFLRGKENHSQMIFGESRFKFEKVILILILILCMLGLNGAATGQNSSVPISTLRSWDMDTILNLQKTRGGYRPTEKR